MGRGRLELVRLLQKLSSSIPQITMQFIQFNADVKHITNILFSQFEKRTDDRSSYICWCFYTHTEESNTEMKENENSPVALLISGLCIPYSLFTYTKADNKNQLCLFPKFCTKERQTLKRRGNKLSSNRCSIPFKKKNPTTTKTVEQKLFFGILERICGQKQKKKAAEPQIQIIEFVAT